MEHQRRFLELLAQFGIEDSAREHLWTTARHRCIAVDDTVFLEGALAHTVGFVVVGSAKLIRISNDGEESITRLLIPGEWYGLASLLEQNRAFPATAIAVEPMVTAEWSVEHFMAAIGNHPSLALHLIRKLITTVHALQERLHDLATQDVEHRLARIVLLLIRQAGRTTPDGIEIELPLRRYELAELTGTTVYTVSRTLRQWERKGWLKLGRKRLVVCSTSQLTRLLGEVSL